MANQRVRLDAHIEEYLKTQSDRVLGKSPGVVTSADLTTLVNAICYEHKLAQSMAKQIPLAKLFSWVITLIPGSGSKVVPLAQSADTPALKAQPKVENFDFDADLGDLYEDEAA